MNRHPRPTRPRPRLLPVLAALLLLAACAPSAIVHAPASAAEPAPIVVEAVPAVAPSAPGLLPPVPQPPERPVAPPSVTDPALSREQRIAAFVDYTATTYGVDRGRIRSVLAGAEHKQSIVDAMSRPAEAVRPWRDYRPIFINDARISGGRAFYAENRAALDRVAADTGVPAEYIVAIIGVETSYGRITGNHRVLDALYTLAFGFPRRAPFFAGELAQLFALVAEEPQLDLAALKGSYAGAMGMGQFMPSSYRLWAKDGDGDGRRDLLTHKPDVFASIANYFVIHGWERGAPVVARADKAAGAEEFVPSGDPKSLEPDHSLPLLAQQGFTPRPGEPVGEGATVIALDGDAGREYWLGYRNFYVISRYNRSPMYSLAVHQLAQAIAGREPQ
ncbi:lytic murein transglycosylase B [Luteimonas terricola]|uniref:Lytic murein transglycosylase B n=1 Tax=Luteimonas terricola TaxID=645597 RepID=A0ABQ2E730_9GAMM|nr:lytic murein transglycosylase B [Luteimonas terricola]GGJ97968.1 lytic murein transglycosylase B [Luteimonas terricola]